MKIAIGCDHVGLELKPCIVEHLEKRGHTVQDFGTNSYERTDYPIYGKAVAEAVASGACEKGIVLCGTGVGISIAANKIHGTLFRTAVAPPQRYERAGARCARGGQRPGADDCGCVACGEIRGRQTRKACGYAYRTRPPALTVRHETKNTASFLQTKPCLSVYVEMLKNLSKC